MSAVLAALVIAVGIVFHLDRVDAKFIVLGGFLALAVVVVVVDELYRVIRRVPRGGRHKRLEG